MPDGYYGRALVIDAATGESEQLELPERVLRDYLGGVGLGAWLMHRLAPPRVDPLAAEAPLAFVFSPFVGTPLTTSAKFAVVAKSPLTGMLNDALASSHFAIAGKLTGHDAIVVRGACAHPSVLVVDSAGVRVEPAGDLWGESAAHAETRLRERLGQAWRIAAIGPAGESLVRYATVSHDGRHAGRGGLGAVLGAKRIKAVAVRASSGRVPLAEPKAVQAAARTCAAARSGRRPRSIASSARSPTCCRSTSSRPSPPAISAPPPSRAQTLSRPRTSPTCASAPATAAPPARSAASTSTRRPAAVAACAWNTRTSSRSGPCAA